MGQVIDAGELGLVEFPDGMSDADINRALHVEMNKAAGPTARMELPRDPLGAANAYATRREGELAKEGREAQLGREITELSEMRGRAKDIYDPARRAEAEEAVNAEIRKRGVEPLREEKTFGEVATSPLVPISEMAPKGSDFEAVGMPKTAAAVTAGVLQGGASLVEFFTSPLGIATLGTAALPAKMQQAVSATFAADMARHVPEAFTELDKAVADGRTEDAVRLTMQMAGTVYFAGRSAEHGGLTPREWSKPVNGTRTASREIGAALLARIERGEPIEREISTPQPLSAMGERGEGAESAVGPMAARELVSRRGEFGQEIPAVAPKADAMERAMVEAPAETQSDLVGVPVRQVAREEIGVNPELMQFKRMDDAQRGVNAADKLEGKWDDLKAGNLLLWEPKNPAEYGLKEGQRYVVANGHHRFEFGERADVRGFNAQVVREVDGVSASDARALGAEINIADGKGTIYDQAKFIRNERAAHGADAAMARARQVGARGRKAATIAIEASDSLFESFINERLSPEQAEVIARSAPGDEALQRAGIAAALRGKDGAELANYLQAVRASAGGRAEQVDLFGADDSAIKAAEEMAKRASARQKDLSEQIAAVQGAAKRPEQAAKLGVNVSDPAGILARVQELKAQRERWDNWALHPELVAEVRGESAKAPKLRPGEKQGDLISTQTEDFALASERAMDGERIAREKVEAEKTAAEAKAQEEKFQGSLFGSVGDYRADFTPGAARVKRDVFEWSDAELREAFGRNEPRGGVRGDVAAEMAAKEFYFRSYEQFKQWMDERFAEGDLEGMKIAFAEADAQAKIKYIKENRAAEEFKKAWIAHLATGAPLPAGKPPVQRTTPRPGPDGKVRTPEAPRQGPTESHAGARPPRPKRPAPERRVPQDPSAEALGGLEYVRPVEMPEIVRIAKELSGSDIALKKMRASRRGFFDPKTGQTTLNYELFKDPQQAAQTLAHELGHLVDYLPDRAMDRGNILGRLATLRNWLTTTFPAGPKGGAPLTPADRARIRREAEQAAGPRPKDSIGAAAWREEVAELYREMLAKEIDARMLAEANAVWSEAYALSKWWRPFNEQFAPESFIKYRKSSVEVYADALSVLFNAPNELKARAPKFWEMFFNYLERKPEVKKAFVELQETLAGGPAAVTGQRLADSRAGFMKGEEILQEKLREREERRTSWKGFWRDLKTQHHDRGGVLEKQVNSLRKAGIEVPQWMDPRNAWEESLFGNNRNMLDVERAYREVLKPVEDAGLDIEQLGEVLKLQRIIGTAAEGPRLDEAGRKGMNVARDYEGPRAGNRVGKANPQGLAVATARDTLAGLYAQVGAEKAAVLEAATKRFRKLWMERAAEGYRAGIYSERMWNETIVPNADSYVAFRALDHIESFVSPMARKGLGTLKDVENPFITTMYKLASLNNLISVQRAKIAAREFFKQHSPESWKEVPEKVVGRDLGGKLLREQKRFPEQGFERLEMLENGRVKGYDVDPYVAKAFERLAPAETDAILRVLNAGFSNAVYPLIIKYNPNFVVRNARRDWRRSWRNAGAITKMNPAQLARNYLKVWNSARGFVRGELDPLSREMLESYAIATPLEGWHHLDRGDAFGELMKQYRMGTDSQQSALMRKAMWIPEKIAEIGGVFEALPKMAAYRAMVKEGVKGKKYSPGEAAPIVRNYIGTPNFRVKGSHANVVNALRPFTNIFLQGYKADFKVATDPKTKGGFWFRWALTDGAGAVLQGLAKAGLLGGALAALYNGVSEYDLSNYAVLPIGYVAGGDFGMKTVYLRLPRDETSRLMSVATYKLARIAAGDKSARKFPTEIFDFGAGAVPTLTPMLQIGEAWVDYLRGQNPVDPWKGRPVIGDTEHKAGGWDSLKPMMVFTMEKAGLMNLIGWNSEAETVTEVAINSIPGVKGLLKVSDYGYREQQRDAEKEEERLKAIMRLDYSDEVRGLLAEYYRLQDVGERRTQAQTVRYQALQVWHGLYSRFDETSWLLEQGGDKARAKEVRRQMATLSEQFEKDGKLEWGKVVPVWNVPKP